MFSISRCLLYQLWGGFQTKVYKIDGFTTYRRATVMTCLYFKRLMYMQMFCIYIYIKKKKNRVVTIKIRNMVKYVKSSPQRLALFKSCAERKNIECNASLTLDVPTRWNSTYMMLEVVEKYQMAFELMIDEDEHFLSYLYEDGAGKRVLGSPTDDDWCNIRHFIKFL